MEQNERINRSLHLKCIVKICLYENYDFVILIATIICIQIERTSIYFKLVSANHIYASGDVVNSISAKASFWFLRNYQR